LKSPILLGLLTLNKNSHFKKLDYRRIFLYASGKIIFTHALSDFEQDHIKQLSHQRRRIPGQESVYAWDLQEPDWSYLVKSTQDFPRNRYKIEAYAASNYVVQRFQMFVQQEGEMGE
jgi:uncharacterized protein involved in type VI secretion and phage assembly